MSVLFVLIGASVLVAGAFLFAFIRSVRTGQYDDQYTPSVRMLFDEPSGIASSTQQSKTNGEAPTAEPNNH
ncbi:MAG: cbb3-type cytochrome oxidase assembly protein CcoS [Bacteroidetes bacterium]|nr:cbb3-type cytochrome oxidase assembly protein CcoS [Bacteroidota bacterium]